MRCEWAESRAKHLYRCKREATKTVYINGELVYLCIYHANIVNRMKTQKAKHEQLLDELCKEEVKILDLIEQVKSLKEE